MSDELGPRKPDARARMPLAVCLSALHLIAGWDSNEPLTREQRIAREALAELKIVGPPDTKL